jgi:ankyrin repeat protein
MSAAQAATGTRDSRLPDAVRKQDRSAVGDLLRQQGVDVNAAQVDGTTALHWAAHHDDLASAKLLVKAGANPKAVNRYGVTPLSLACTNGSASMVELLLDAGADANAALPGGETALMTAARTGRVEAVNVLLARGADVHAKEPVSGQTALLWAAAEGNVDVVERLIAAKADFRLRLTSGLDPFLIAVREGQIGVVKALLRAGVSFNDVVQPPALPPGQRPRPVPRAPRPGTSALVLAVTNGHFELGAFLLEAGADPNAAASGYTALHVISHVRKPGGGDNDPSPQGSGNLTSLQMVERLVKHGADPNVRMAKHIPFGMTRLNTNGATPFLLAAKTGDAELMRTLASLGADPKLRNEDDSTPLMAAAGLGTRSPGEDAGTEAEVVEAVKVALDLGNDINAVDLNGETAMHGAAYKNLPGVVELLAARGADVQVWNKPNKQGWTPLRIAEGYRFGNFKPSLVTVAALHKVMKAAGVPIPASPAPGNISDYKKKP